MLRSALLAVVTVPLILLQRPLCALAEAAGPAFGDMPDIGWTPTLVTQRTGSVITQAGWTLQNESRLALLTDVATAPVSQPNVIEETTPEGLDDGIATSQQIYEGDVGFSSRRVLTRHAFRFLNGWNWHPTGTNKIGFIWPAAGAKYFTCGWGSSEAAVFYGVGLQNLFSWQGDTSPDSQNLNPGTEAARIVEDDWVILWSECVGNTNGQEDARVRQWVDKGSGPVATLDVTDFAFSSGAALIDRCDIGTMRGGDTGSANPSACKTQTDDFTIWQEAA